MNIEDAYEWCEKITRREAKNFAYGIRLLHEPERQGHVGDLRARAAHRRYR